MRPIFFQSVGADPEVFLTNKNGHFVSAEGRIGGTKTEPKPMDGLPPGFFIQEDNVAAEYNIPPSYDAESFSRNVGMGLVYIKRLAAAQGLKVACVPAAHFDPVELSTPHAQRLGCDPDLNFWTLRYNDPPRPPETLRTAAGHVHIGWEKPDDDQRIAVARLCDLMLGLPSILVTLPSERRSLYGRAGAVRVKDYGLEYRTLDNFWLPNPHYRRFIFDTVFVMMDKYNREHEFLSEELDNASEEIQRAINTHDKDLAKDLIKEFGVAEFPAINTGVKKPAPKAGYDLLDIIKPVPARVWAQNLPVMEEEVAHDVD